MNGFGVGLAARGADATTRLAPLQALSMRALAERSKKVTMIRSFTRASKYRFLREIRSSLAAVIESTCDVLGRKKFWDSSR